MGDRPHSAGHAILVVDDDERFREFVQTLLGPPEYDVVEAATGSEALARVAEAGPELVVLDVQLPGISGYEVCRVLREAPPSPAILFVSGERREALDRVAGLLLG